MSDIFTPGKVRTFSDYKENYLQVGTMVYDDIEVSSNPLPYDNATYVAPTNNFLNYSDTFTETRNIRIPMSGWTHAVLNFQSTCDKQMTVILYGQICEPTAAAGGPQLVQLAEVVIADTGGIAMFMPYEIGLGGATNVYTVPAMLAPFYYYIISYYVATEPTSGAVKLFCSRGS